MAIIGQTEELPLNAESVFLVLPIPITPITPLPPALGKSESEVRAEHLILGSESACTFVSCCVTYWLGGLPRAAL